MKRINKEKEEIEKWNEEDKLENLQNPYDKLQKRFLEQEFLRERLL